MSGILATVRRSLAAASILVLAACSSSTEPTVESVAGEYEATTFTLTTSEGTRDLLAEGGHLRLNLRRVKTLDGELSVPGGAEDGSDLTEDMRGSWELLEGQVRFYQLADTFVRDTPFTVDGRRLVADIAFGDAEIRIVMGRIQSL